jgi:hypothetical protein
MTQRGFTLWACTWALGIALGSVALAGDKVSGEVVDLSCYLGHPNTSTGSGHRKCAETCAKKGLPMGLLTAEKEVYLLLEDHDNPKAYAAALAKAAQQTTVEGRTVNLGGVRGIIVDALVE